MKKISIIALIVLTLTLIASCGTAGTGNNADVSYTDATEVITKVWNTFGEDEKFPVGGGDSANLVMDTAGKFDVANTEELDVTLALPASQHANIEEAASMMHMMNANQLTVGAYKLKADVDMTAFADDYKSGLDSRRWMCGFPEKYVVISSGNYVMTAFGNAMNIDLLKTKALEALDSATVVSEGNIEA